MRTPDRTFPTLNALRAIGAILVVLTHSAFNTGRINDGWTGAMLARFDFGVTLFFVLSGFLLSRPFFLRAFQNRPAPATTHYLWKRALRVLPLYWAVVLAVATGMFSVPELAAHGPDLVRASLAPPEEWLPHVLPA